MFRILISGLVALIVGAGLAGCTDDEGPAERLGERVDDAVSDARDRAEETRDELEEAADEIGDALRDN